MTRRSQRRAFYALRGRPAVLCRWRCFSARRSGRLPDHAFSRRFRSLSRRLPTPLFGLGRIPPAPLDIFRAVFHRGVSFRRFIRLSASPDPFSFRGFLLSYSVSVLLAGGVPVGRACLIVGLPALFSLTALFFAWRGGVLLLSGYIPNLPRLSDRPVFVRFRRPASDRRAAHSLPRHSSGSF